MTDESPLSVLWDLAEILWLPLLIGTVTAAATWLIWYYTATPCLPEAALSHYCNPARIARYVNVEIWARCLTLGTLAGASSEEVLITPCSAGNERHVSPLKQSPQKSASELTRSASALTN